MPRQIGWKTNRDGVRMTVCQGCGAHANENRIEAVIKDVWARVEAGEVMPAGECRKCGAVVHLLPLYDKDAARDEELSQLAELADFLEETHQDEIANRHHGDAGGSRTCSYCQAIKKARALIERAAGPVAESDRCPEDGFLKASDACTHYDTAGKEVQ